LLTALEEAGHTVTLVTLTPHEAMVTELASLFSLSTELAKNVADAIAEDEFPLILSGNCTPACIGAIAGLGSERLGIVWLDGHRDSEDPAETRDAYVDAMALTIATGRSWRGMAERVPGFQALQADHVFLAGARATLSECARLQEAGATVVPRRT